MTNPDKMQLVNQGVARMIRFCELNDIEAPYVKIYTGSWRYSACAFYRPVSIRISPRHCAHIGTAGRAWSYPGYAIDRTPYGVIQHELGHHVDWLLSSQRGAYGGDFSVDLRSRSQEKKITNYCPNDWEWFAEIFRLFVTNPDLLMRIRPKVHEELANRFKPVETRSWQEVLAAAPQRTIEMALRK